ncbi:hypothetical protein V6708_23915, partial [Klebsiella pneumoniae]|uniref:hypothetical protein n=1 Tax=Klebsiella pneumoniae TaxID=573 RepID=UPI002FF24C8E
KHAYCLKTQPATGETYPKSDLFNKAVLNRGVPFTGSDLVLDDIGGGNKIYMGDGSRSGASP